MYTSVGDPDESLPEVDVKILYYPVVIWSQLSPYKCIYSVSCYSSASFELELLSQSVKAIRVMPGNGGINP